MFESSHFPQSKQERHLTTNMGSDTYSSLDSSDDHSSEGHDTEHAFEEVYYLMCFFAALWIIGKCFARMGLPGLVGEIIVGIILGPHLLDFVPESDTMIVIGEMGLVMLVLEAGIDVDIGMLKLIGTRGLLVAVFGSMIPLLIGWFLSFVIAGNDFIASLSIGACLAPTSMGIALNVLRCGKVLNTPTGQLIIAAAILDDVIALMLLSELEALEHPTFINIALPLIVSPIFILLFGFLAIRVVPGLLEKIMSKVPSQFHEYAILGMLFSVAFGMFVFANVRVCVILLFLRLFFA